MHSGELFVVITRPSNEFECFRFLSFAFEHLLFNFIACFETLKDNSFPLHLLIRFLLFRSPTSMPTKMTKQFEYKSSFYSFIHFKIHFRIYLNLQNVFPKSKQLFAHKIAIEAQKQTLHCIGNLCMPLDYDPL